MSFDVNGANFYPKVLPKDINDYLHKLLVSTARWNIVTDNLPIDVFQQSHGGTDAGSIICSYRDVESASIRVESELKLNDDNYNDPLMKELNFYAEMIGRLVLNRSIVKKEYLISQAFSEVHAKRYFWNYYHSNSIGLEHTDITEPNHWSIIYYLNDNPDTGTRIVKPDGTELIAPNNAGDAVLFPSNWVHNGIPPKGNTHRCCLNILFKAKYCFDEEI